MGSIAAPQLQRRARARARVIAFIKMLRVLVPRVHKVARTHPSIYLMPGVGWARGKRGQPSDSRPLLLGAGGTHGRVSRKTRAFENTSDTLRVLALVHFCTRIFFFFFHFCLRFLGNFRASFHCCIGLFFHF